MAGIDERTVLKLFGSKTNLKKIQKPKCEGKERTIGLSQRRKEECRKSFKKAPI